MRIRRILRSAGFCGAVSLSLLSFPGHLPWMLLAWIGGFAIQTRRGLRAWPPLLLAVSFVLIKRVDWPPSVVVLLLVMTACGAADWARRRRPRISARLLAGISLLLLAGAWVFMALEWRGGSRTQRHPPFVDDRPIVCVGDSLSAKGFPGRLAERVRVRVLDFARPGITAPVGRERLSEGLKLHPQTVVLEIGGQDYLKGRSRRETMAELEAMIQESRAAGAEVILFEIPRGVVMDGFSGLERELSRKYDLELVGDGAIRQLIFFSPLTPLVWTGRKLSNDGLHPNDRGHEFLADRALEALRHIYGDTVLRPR